LSGAGEPTHRGRGLDVRRWPAGLTGPPASALLSRSRRGGLTSQDQGGDPMKLHALIGAAVALGLAAPLAAPAAAQERISIGTGGTAGVFYVVGAGMAEVLTRHLDGHTATAEVTGASVENILRVSAGEITFGFSSSSTLYDAVQGNEPFDAPHNVKAIAYLYPAALQPAALQGSGAASIDDLAGKRVGIGPPGSNSAVLAERLLDAYGVLDQVEAHYMSYGEATNAIQDGNLDATFVLAGIPAAALIELSTTRDVTFLPVDRDRLAGLLEEFPYYNVSDIPAGSYEGQTEPIPALGDPVMLFAHADADEELIYRITRTIYENLDELGPVHPMARFIEVGHAEEVPVEIHPGARRYFDEAR
jgi:uncharacterized protein